MADGTSKTVLVRKVTPFEAPSPTDFTRGKIKINPDLAPRLNPKKAESNSKEDDKKK